MIDWSQVATLRDDVGVEDFDDVLVCFLEEVEETLGRLSNTSCAATCEADLHFLKGSALNLGFETFAARCAQGEALAQNGKSSDIDVTALRSCYETSKQQFFASLNKICDVTALPQIRGVVSLADHLGGRQD